MCCCLLNVVLHRLLLLFLCIRVLRCPQQLVKGPPAGVRGGGGGEE